MNELLNSRKVLEKGDIIVFPNKEAKNIAEWVCVGLSYEVVKNNATAQQIFCKKMVNSIQRIVKKHLTIGDVIVNPEKDIGDIVTSVLSALDNGEIKIPSIDTVRER
ncbi:MAG: hypothetical protein NTV07_00965 [Candidatus Omnitrophica bacterium]|nr:hypothetical protein [Candidatus Omnitrophota bacterium]